MVRKRILIVDYEPKLVARLQSLIPEDKYEVSTAQDGITALEAFDGFKPDFVLLRTMLPKKHGFQVCQEMVERSGSRRIPIVMHCSIYKSKKYRNDAMKIYGASEYLEDPIEPEVLGAVLDRFLQGTPPAAQPGAVQPGGEQDQAAPPAADKPKKKAASRGVDQALEDTLSGLNLGLGKKKKAPAEAPLEKAPPPEEPKEEAEHKEAAPEEEGVTSEEIFGEAIQDVIEEPEEEAREVAPPVPEPVAKEETPAEAEAPEEAPSAEDAEKAKKAPPKKAPPKKRPVIDVESAIGSGILHPKSFEDSKVTRIKSRSEQELSRKLEDTLSGVKLGKKTTSKAAPPKKAEEPAPPPVEAEEKAKEKEPGKPAPPPVKAEEKAKEKEPEKPVPAEEEKGAEEEGIRYGNYILMNKVALGGMAELFKARQNGVDGFKRIVAIKRILPHLAADREFVTMFTDEAKLAAQLSHPNIGHIYELGKLEDSYFIAMEFVDGKDLRAILKEMESRGARMPFRVSVYIAQRVCSALSYAHRAKDMDGKPMDLVHRDVSPQNIILSTNGEVKLVDFGIAKAASKASHTQSGALKGKLLYMSPEQAWGKTIDLRADIFALGTVLWELLTGKKLFYGDSEMSILEKVREAVVEPPHVHREDVPEDLERIVLKALKKDPLKRFRTCKAMLAELERFSYKEWETLPSAYDAAAFLHGFFPDVYKREMLESLKREPEQEPETKGEKAVPPRAKEGAKAGGKAPKGQRGRPAPIKKKAKVPPEKAKEPSAAPPPKEPKKPVPTAPPPEPPKRAEESASGVMFKGVVAKGKGSKKNLGLLAGVVAALVVIVAVVLFIWLKPKKTPTPTPQPKQPEIQKQAQAPEVQPPPVEVNKPEEAPTPTAPQPTQAEVRAARRAASSAVGSLNRSVSNLTKAEAPKYAPDAFTSLKAGQRNAAALLRRASTVAQYVAAKKAADDGLQLVGQVRAKVDDAKAAEAQAAAKKAREDEAARKAAEEEARKAKEAEAKKKQAQEAARTKRGDFVELWAVDLRPKAIKNIRVDYTPMARRNKVSGTVYIQASINETGAVTGAKVLKGPKPDYGLNQACVKAALATKYTPAIKDGVPVKTTLTYPVVFKINR